MCGIAGILSLGPAAAAERQRAVGHDRAAASPRARRHGVLSCGPDRPGACAPEHHRPRRRRAADPQRGQHRLGHLQRRDLQLHRAARDLERQGHRFYTHSDTEVIVHLYEQYGDDFVAHLNGQFAIALWDVTRQRLVLARDRTGIRPLFYTTRRRPAAVCIRGRRRCSPSPTCRAGSIRARWARSSPSGRRWRRARCSRASQSLPPGHTMVVDERGTRVRALLGLELPRRRRRCDARSEQDCADELRALLIDAVRLQLRADVPVGAYLSGGLDSSIVTSVIKNFTDTPLRTFSLTFEDAEFDESAHQNELVAYLGTDHTSVRCTPRRHRRGVPAHDLARRDADRAHRADAADAAVAKRARGRLQGGADRRGRRRGVRRLRPVQGSEDPALHGAGAGVEVARRASWSGSTRTCSTRRPPAGRSRSASSARGWSTCGEPYFAHIPRWTTTRRIWQFFSADVRERLAGIGSLRRRRARRLPADIGRWAPMARTSTSRRTR